MEVTGDKREERWVASEACEAKEVARRDPGSDSAGMETFQAGEKAGGSYGEGHGVSFEADSDKLAWSHEMWPGEWLAVEPSADVQIRELFQDASPEKSPEDRIEPYLRTASSDAEGSAETGKAKDSGAQEMGP